MVLPLYSDDPLEGDTKPYVNWALIAVNFLVFMVILALPTTSQESLVRALAFVPATEMREQAGGSPFPPELTLISSMFLHANVAHVLGNMLFLWIFGADVEDALGHLRYLLLYILCGVGGAMAFLAIDPHSTILLVGASGAISGVMTAFLILRPCAKIEVWTYVWAFGVRAVWFVTIWILLQVLGVVAQPQDGVAYADHVGGILAGAILLLALRPSKLHLFECLWPTKEWDQAHGRTRRWAIEHVVVLGAVAVALVLYAGLIAH